MGQPEGVIAMRKYPFNEEGSSLILVMIATVMISASSLLVSEKVVTAFKAQNKSSSIASKAALVRFFTEATDCSNSTAISICTSNASNSANLYRTGSNTFIASKLGAGIKYGKWTVKLECPSATSGYILRVTRLSATGTLASTADADFAPDPVTNQITKWTDAGSLLLPSGQSLCSPNAPSNETALRPLRTESQVEVLANQCDNNYVVGGDHFCTTDFYKTITFNTPFRTPPNVVVTLDYACDSGLAPCTGGSSDSVLIDAKNITTNGFKMSCSGSPPTGFCSTSSATHCAAYCNWSAVGN
jgi:H-type lectin domain